MESSSLKDELLQLNNFSIITPTASAFVPARGKIKVEAFKILFYRFNGKSHQDKLFKGYRLLPIDITIYDETTESRFGTNAKSYSDYHLDASYDLLECTYGDLIIQGEAIKNENDAFCQLIDRYKGKKAIFVADRGYESYNDFEHAAKSRNKYLIRFKDIISGQFYQIISYIKTFSKQSRWEGPTCRSSNSKKILPIRPDRTDA